jgi:hypothetical protein
MGSFRGAQRFILLAFRPAGATDARTCRNERKDAINANFASISAVSTDGCPAVPFSEEPNDGPAIEMLGALFGG